MLHILNKILIFIFCLQYFCGLLLILVAQISAGIWAFSNKDSLQRLLHHTVTQTIQYEYGKPEYQQRTIAFDAIQKEVRYLADTKSLIMF